MDPIHAVFAARESEPSKIFEWLQQESQRLSHKKLRKLLGRSTTYAKKFVPWHKRHNVRFELNPAIFRDVKDNFNYIRIGTPSGLQVYFGFYPNDEYDDPRDSTTVGWNHLEFYMRPDGSYLSLIELPPWQDIVFLGQLHPTIKRMVRGDYQVRLRQRTEAYVQGLKDLSKAKIDRKVRPQLSLPEALSLSQPLPLP